MTLLSAQTAWAGNDNRRGTSGATELGINPWARSTGWGSVSVANVRGIDAFYSNIAGLCYVDNIELAYSNTMLFGGKSGLSSGGSINAFGLGVRVFDQGVLGVSIMSMGFGDIPVTTVNDPEGNGTGTFSPSIMNINVAYAHAFTNSIRGGVNIKVITESTEDVTGTGFGVDAGIQYVTGADDELKFGISLKNWGPSMSFSGTGLSFQFVNNAGNTMTAEYRAGEMELPTCLNIGASYDFLIEAASQRITLAGSFTSNAFTRDVFAAGLEYSIFKMLCLRAAYVYQAGEVSANRGLSAGASVDIPLSKKEDNKSGLSIDYSYRTASPLKGTHAIGATFRF